MKDETMPPAGVSVQEELHILQAMKRLGLSDNIDLYDPWVDVRAQAAMIERMIGEEDEESTD